jgi:adenylate cyclase
MSSKEIDRKIAVIFATDVVGYSKLMENDEDHTIKAIRACKEILETLFKEHGGRTFNTAGDSILAGFLLKQPFRKTAIDDFPPPA